MTLAEVSVATNSALALQDRRLLLLSTNLGLGGGAEEQVIRMSMGLKDRGWQVEVVSMLPPKPLPADFEKSGIPVRSLDMARGVADPRGIFRLAQLVRRFQPAILHSHMTHANLLARTARLICPIPVLVCTLHGLKMHSVGGGSTRLRELAHRVTDRFADLTTTICRAAANSYIEDGSVPAGKIEVFPNGVDTTRFCPNAFTRARVRRDLGIESEFVWLAVGRLEKPKAYGTMIRAFAQLHRETHPDAVLLICGNGSLEAEMKQLAQELGVGGKVRFLGLRRDIPEVMNAADGYLMSSDTEGLPMVLLQASASGIPIVATAVGGNSEVVADARSGYIVTPGNPDAMAAAMQRLLDLPVAERRSMGLAGRAYTIANFEAKHVFDQWNELYRKMLAKLPPAKHDSAKGRIPGRGPEREVAVDQE
jgi:glycosyltransferase involved in cell wall biosynthesis